MVLATVTHDNSYIHRLRFEENDLVLEPTDRHRLYSVTHRAWLPTEELQPGEELLTRDSSVRIASNERVEGSLRVYNLQVETEESYYVSTKYILSHNTNPCASAAGNGGSILLDASKAAFNAANDAGSIFIKNKHLSSATGNYAKFATTDISTAQEWVQQALRSPSAMFFPNPQLSNTFQVVANLGTTIGTKGQTSIRVIVGFDGKVINAFPVR